MSSELGRRIAFTPGALLVYCIGSYIPLPGIDPSVCARVFGDSAGAAFSACFAHVQGDAAVNVGG